MTVEMTWRKFFLSHAIFQETSPEMDVENCQCHGKKTNIQHFSMLYTLIDHKNDVKPLARFVNILTSTLWLRAWKIVVEWLIGHIVNKLEYR